MSRPADPGFLAEIQATASALSEPAEPVQTMARVAALLSPYYDKATPQGIREIDAEDWAEALAGFPFWAIEAACRWWKSADNPNRARRPVEGDIAARCRVETDGLNAALSGRLLARREPEREPRCSPEAAAEIMASNGIRVNRFGGDA